MKRAGSLGLSLGAHPCSAPVEGSLALPLFSLAILLPNARVVITFLLYAAGPWGAPRTPWVTERGVRV
jgi:hypothetical protein